MQSQAFFEKGHWECSPRPLSWFIWVSKLLFCLFGKKKPLNRRNVKHIKLVLSKKGKNLRRQTSPQAYMYICMYVYIYICVCVCVSLFLSDTEEQHPSQDDRMEELLRS